MPVWLQIVLPLLTLALGFLGAAWRGWFNAKQLTSSLNERAHEAELAARDEQIRAREAELAARDEQIQAQEATLKAREVQIRVLSEENRELTARAKAAESAAFKGLFYDVSQAYRVVMAENERIKEELASALKTVKFLRRDMSELLAANGKAGGGAAGQPWQQLRKVEDTIKEAGLQFEAATTTMENTINQVAQRAEAAAGERGKGE